MVAVGGSLADGLVSDYLHVEGHFSRGTVATKGGALARNSSDAQPLHCHVVLIVICSYH